MLSASNLIPRTQTGPTMLPPIRPGAQARRCGDSPISDLMARALNTPDLVSLAAGFVDHATLPVEATARAAASVLGDELEARRSLQYGTTRGDGRLRKHLIERLVRQGELAPDQAAEVEHRTIVTSGSQQLLYLLAEALLDPGDIVLVESPTYFVFLGVLRSFGARVIGVETDAGGLKVDALEATLAALDEAGELPLVKMVYTISEHSNPTGLSLAADRRGPLVETVRSWSRRQRIFLVEDSAYRGLTFDGNEPPSVWAHDLAGDTVIHARTFSKTYSPGMKVGYGIVPAALMETLLALKGHHDFGTAHFNQQVLDRVLTDGGYDRQVAVLQATYRRKRDALLAALDQHLGGVEGVSWTQPRGGLYVWLTLPEGVDTGRDGAFFARCLEHGVLYVPGALAYPEEPGPVPANHARLSFGVAGPEGLAEGVRRLAAALADCLAVVA
jgi:2-aminoadipate transaminase